MSREDFADGLRTERHEREDEAPFGESPALSSADLMRLGVAQEREEDDAEVNTIREARICDCEDNLHPYAPTTDDWEWMPADAVEGVRIYHAGVHVRYRTTITIWLEDAA